MIDYKEIKKKDGSILIFCDLNELLKEFYGTEEYQPYVNSTGEYIIHCPFCKEEGHTKHKLYIKDDLSVGHCFVCNRSYIGVTDEIKFETKMPEFYTSFQKPFEVVGLRDDQPWNLNRLQYEFDDYDEKGFQYLVGRHKYMAELYKILGFKFWNGNVVMPFFYHGKPFYYQIRFTGDSKIRYYFPPVSSKPPYCIETCEHPKKFIICEGVFDAISLLIQAPSYTPFAVLGSSISDYQIGFLREYIPEKILIYMDETKISNGIAAKLRSIIDYCPIEIIKSDGEDPEEHMIRRMNMGANLQWIK